MSTPHSPQPRRAARTAALATGLVLAAALLTGGCAATSAAGGGPDPDPSTARQQLGQLTVGTPRSMAGYSRERFPHWTQQGGNCDTREFVLKRDGIDVKTDTSCHVLSGHWLSRYDDEAFNDPTRLDIDHMVPLANAWRSGADGWTDEQRSKFANDLTRPQLLAVSASSNRAKGDQDPAQWKPPNHGYWCQYAQRWVAVKQYWHLSVTAAEKAALVDMLGTCQWQSSARQT